MVQCNIYNVALQQIILHGTIIVPWGPRDGGRIAVKQRSGSALISIQ